MTTLTIEAPTEVLPFNVDAWRKEGHRLAKAEAGFAGDHKKALRQMSQANWDIGDWLSKGDKHLRGQAYVEAFELTGKDESTLHDLVRVARVFPDVDSRRRESLYWSHYKEVSLRDKNTGLPRIDQATRDRLLTEAENAHLSVKRLRELVKREQKKLEPRSAKDTRTVGVIFTQNEYKQITKLANIRARQTRHLIRIIVREYFQSNRKAIEEAFQEYDARITKSRQDLRKVRKAEREERKLKEAADDAARDALSQKLRDNPWARRLVDLGIEIHKSTRSPDVARLIRGYFRAKCGTADFLEIPVAACEEFFAKLDSVETPEAKLNLIKELASCPEPISAVVSK